jgi:hypothetical protein
MLICKLTISYDRGLSHNDEQDLSESADGVQVNVIGRGAVTKDGKIIRGLGTHFKSEADRDLVKARDQEASRIRTEFRKRFVSTPIDGTYIVGEPGIAKRFISELGYRSDMRVFVQEFNLECPSGMDNSELSSWAERIKKQLSSVSLGRGKEADADGLRALETLASCPVIKPETGRRIKELVAMVRDNKMERIEVRRRIETMQIEVNDSVMSPRRTPALVGEDA